MKYLSKTAFARHIGCVPGWVTELHKDGRLVMSQDGRKVDVEASAALIAATSGGRDDVASRWARNRAAKPGANVPTHQPGTENGALPPSGQPVTPSAPITSGDAGQPGPDSDRAELASLAARKARAAVAKEEAQAEQERIKAARMRGEVIDISAVEAAFRFIGAAMRSAMDVFPDQVSPIVAPVTDLADVHALITEACRNVLIQLGDTTDRQREALAAIEKEARTA